MLSVLLIGTCFVLSHLGFWLEDKGYFNEWLNIGGGFLTGVIGFILAIIFIINHSITGYTISQYNVIKDTIEMAREGEISEIERAALTQKIIEVNQEIASYKYWNGTIFEGFIPDEWAELEELK